MSSIKLHVFVITPERDIKHDNRSCLFLHVAILAGLTSEQGSRQNFVAKFLFCAAINSCLQKVGKYPMHGVARKDRKEASLVLITRSSFHLEVIETG